MLGKYTIRVSVADRLTPTCTPRLDVFYLYVGNNFIDQQELVALLKSIRTRNRNGGDEGMSSSSSATFDNVNSIRNSMQLDGIAGDYENGDSSTDEDKSSNKHRGADDEENDDGESLLFGGGGGGRRRQRLPASFKYLTSDFVLLFILVIIVVVTVLLVAFVGVVCVCGRNKKKPYAAGRSKQTPNTDGKFCFVWLNENLK